MKADPRRILIIEDQILISMDLEEIVNNCGSIPVGPAHTISEALRFVSENEFDAAILDINIDGDMVFSVADRLSILKKPFIFITGYTTDDFPDLYPGVPIVAKPFSRKGLSAAIAEIACKLCSRET